MTTTNEQNERREQFTKQLSRMLKDQDGREVLGKHLGMQLIPNSGDRPRVLIMVPSYGNPKPAAQAAWEVMIAEARKVADVHRPMLYGHSIIHWVRNDMVARAYQDAIAKKVDFTHILMIDDDIEPQPDALVRMLSHKKDIVGALTTKRADPPIPTLRDFDQASGDWTQKMTWKQGGLIQVDGVGTGMILMSKKALDAIGDFYLHCGYERTLLARHLPPNASVDTLAETFTLLSEARQKQHDTNPDDRWRQNACWFQTLPALNGCGEYGEDMSFCLKAKLVGIPVYCDTDVTPFHIGEYGYSIADYFGYKHNLIAEAKRQGRYVDGEAPKPDERRLSVVIPLFNQLEMTKQCVTSLLENTRAKLDILFVDDNSTDGTREWLAEMAWTYDGKNTRAAVTVFYNQGNRGVNYSWNRGLEQATGDYIAVCNNDIIFSPGWDTPLLDKLSDEQIGIVSPKHTYGQDRPADWPFGAERTINPVADAPILGCCFAFTRKLYETVGNVPESMKHYWGDDWFGWAAQRYGKRCEYVPASYIHHYFAQTTRTVEWENQWNADKVAFEEAKSNVASFDEITGVAV